MNIKHDELITSNLYFSIIMLSKLMLEKDKLNYNLNA